MAKRPRIRWTGDLARPIKWRGPLTKQLSPTIAVPEPSAEAQSENADRYEKANHEVVLEAWRKLEILKEHFEIPRGPGSELGLALRLAMEFVPGFRLVLPGEGRGRKRVKWTDGALIGLIADVETIKEETGRNTDTAALDELLRRPNEYNNYHTPRTDKRRKEMADSLNARLTVRSPIFFPRW
jgi:hypothetical protein